MKLFILIRRGIAAVLLFFVVVGCSRNPGLDPENDRFKAVPDLCRLLSQSTTVEVLGGIPDVKSSGGQGVDSCSWVYHNSQLEGAGISDRRMRVTGVLFRSNGDESGANMALHDLERISRDSQVKLESIAGVGERAIRGTTNDSVEYVFLAGNLQLQMSYQSIDLHEDGTSGQSRLAEIESMDLALEISRNLSQL